MNPSSVAAVVKRRRWPMRNGSANSHWRLQGSWPRCCLLYTSTIVYGRPYSKDPKSGEVRNIWGTLVPYGKVWRTGADEATLLTTEQPIVLGGTTVPAGTYSLFTLPAADGTAKLIVNKKTGQWGIPYKEQSEATNELARIDLKKNTLDKTVDQFTMAIEMCIRDRTNGCGTLPRRISGRTPVTPSNIFFITCGRN